MPTINVEMMKQLLQEFTEKEALTGEEIKAIEQQVAELNDRIGGCHEKLKNLNEDRERLSAMTSRYVDGKFSSPGNISMGKEPEMVGLPGLAAGSSFSKNRPTSQPAKIENKSADLGTSEDQSEQATTHIKTEPAVETPTAWSDQEEKVESEASSESKTADKGKAAESGSGDDAIKSINEALKGLFRK